MWKGELSLLLAFVLLAAPFVNPGVAAGEQDNAGSLQLSTSGAYGQGSYIVEYKFPSSVQTGSNLTVQLTLLVNDLTGMESYILRYYLVVTLYIDTSHVLKGSVGEPTGTEGLYPGAHWGPKNVTVPLTSSNTGIAPGTVANVSVSIALEDQVWIAYPIDYNFPEMSQSGSAGSVLIHGSGQTFNLLDYAQYLLIGAGAVVLVIALLIPATKRKKLRTET